MADKNIGFRITIKGSSETIKKLSEVELELKKIAKQLKDAESNTDAYAKLREQQERLRATAKNLRQDLKEQQQAFENTKNAEGSYRALNAELVKLRNQFKNLSQAEREGQLGKDTVARIQQLDGQLKKIDGSIGQFQRNVGNYAGGLRGLFKGLQQQLNATALFGRISNFPALLSSVEAGIEKVKQVLDDYRRSTDASFVLQEKINGSTKDAISNYITERGQLEGLVNVVKDENAGKAERKAAIDSLNSQFGEYGENLLTEASTLQEIADFQAKATENLIKNIAAQQQAKIAQELFLDAAQKDLAVQKARTEIGSDFLGINDAIIGALQKQSDVATEAAARSGEAGASLENTLKKIEARAKELGLDFALLFNPEELAKDGNKAAEEIKKTAEKAAEEAEKARQLLIKIQIEFNKTSEKAAADSAAALEKARIDAIENAREKEVEQEKASLAEFKKSQQERIAAFIESQQKQIEEAKKEKNIERAEVAKLEQQLQADRVKLEQDTQKLVASEIEQSNKRIAEINKKFAEQQAEARAEIIKAQLDETLRSAEAAAGRTEGAVQSVSLKLNYDQEAADLAFEAAQADLELQRERGLIDERAFNDQLSALQIEKAEADLQRAKDRANIEQQLNAQLLAQQQVANNARLAVDLQAIKDEKAQRLAQLQDQLAQGLISQQEYEDARLAIIESSGNRENDARAATLQANADLEQQYTQEVLTEAQRRANAEIEIEAQKQAALKAQKEGQLKEIAEVATQVGQVFGEVTNAINQIADQAAENRIAEIQKRYEQEAKFAFGNAETIKQIEEKQAREIEKVRKQQAARQKATAIVQAIINGAVAITTSLAQLGPIAGAVAAAVVAATTAAQIAVIASQKLERGGVLFADGGDMGEGVLSGPSHADGGIPVVTPDGRVVEVEGGEYLTKDENGAHIVINKRSTRAFKRELDGMRGLSFAGKRDVLSAINSHRGWGRKFAAGGDISTPLSAPAFASRRTDTAGIEQQNALLRQQLQQNQARLDELQQKVLDIRVINDPEETLEVGNRKMNIKKVRNLGDE